MEANFLDNTLTLASTCDSDIRFSFVKHGGKAIQH